MKSPIPYYGGKTTLAEAIAATFPPHDHYIEPFAGSLAVLLAKTRSKMETVNDIDGDLMTFWRTLRDSPDKLAEACSLTPHSRSEYLESMDLSGVDDLERARRVWVKLSQGRGATLRRTGWRFYRDPAGSNMGMPGYLAAYVDRLLPAAERLAGVSLESGDALDIIREYGKHEDALLYCDPPYFGSRVSNYRHEMTSLSDHQELAQALRECRATVVLSGYDSTVYTELFAGWHRTEFRAWTGNGIGLGQEKTDGNRVEVLWSNVPLGQQDLLDFGGGDAA